MICYEFRSDPLKSAYENAIAGPYAEPFQGYAEAAGNAAAARN